MNKGNKQTNGLSKKGEKAQEFRCKHRAGSGAQEPEYHGCRAGSGFRHSESPRPHTSVSRRPTTLGPRAPGSVIQNSPMS